MIRFKRKRLIMSTQRIFFILLFIMCNAHNLKCVVYSETTSQLSGNNHTSDAVGTAGRFDSGRAIYSPQLEFTEWVPMGRGDPLKNDPTYDYSPPKLDLVKYWADGTGHKEKSKTDILLLGVPQQRPKEPTNKHGSTRRNFAYNDLPTMLMPPPAHHSFNNHIQPHVPIESYQMPTQNINWGNRKSIVDTYVEPTRSYTTVFRPILSSTIYQYHHTYKGPSGVEGSNLIEPGIHHQPLSLQDTFDKPLETLPPFLPTRLPDDFSTISDRHKPALIKTLEGSPFANPSNTKRPVGLSDNLDAQSINYEFTYQTTVPTSTTERSTTPYVPAPPPPPETTTTTEPTTTTSMYSRFERSTRTPQKPMSLVIEGHSKVKTYKPGAIDPKEKHRPVLVQIQPPNDPIQRRVVNTEDDGKLLEVKHLHASTEKKSEIKKVELEKPEEPSAVSSLLSFLDTSFGGFLAQEESSSSEELDGETKDTDLLKNVQGNDLDKDKEHFRKARNTHAKPHFKKKNKTSTKVE